jgi:hypothetical protein
MRRRVHPEARALLAEIHAYRERTGLDRTGFGLAAANDGHLLPRLEAGRQPRWETIDRVRRFMKRKNGR